MARLDRRQVGWLMVPVLLVSAGAALLLFRAFPAVVRPGETSPPEPGDAVRRRLPPR